MLKPGETIVYCGGWHGAVRVQIEQIAQTDVAEIPEETIKQRGRLQLWGQRQKLLPRLAADPLMSGPDHLAQMLERGCLLVNMFMKLNHLRWQLERSEALQARIAQRFGAESKVLGDSLGLAPEQVSCLLTKVFEDCASIAGWNEEEWAYLRPLLDQAFNALGESLEAFEAGFAHRPMKRLKELESLDSI